MLFTTHALAGAALGVATGNPIAGFSAGFISHHILDCVPHFDQGSFYTQKSGARYLGQEAIRERPDSFSKRDWFMLFADFLTAGAIFLLIIFLADTKELSLIIVGALGGLLPDIIGSSPLWSKKLEAKFSAFKKYKNFHSYFHWTVSVKEVVLGMGTQAAVAVFSIAYLLAKL